MVRKLLSKSMPISKTEIRQHLQPRGQHIQCFTQYFCHMIAESNKKQYMAL